jgi:transcription elongation GreA/GreB family factor
VTLRDSRGCERVVVLVTADEVGHVAGGASAASPLGHAIMGAREGELVELVGPRGAEEWKVERITWPE